MDGGAVVNNLLMQFQADLIGIPVIRPETIETTALGAAYLAGLAVDYWSSVEEISEQWAVDRIFTRNISEEDQRIFWLVGKMLSPRQKTGPLITHKPNSTNTLTF